MRQHCRGDHNDIRDVTKASSNLLTAALCRNTKDPKLHTGGNGLFLAVSPTGGKSWILRTRHAGKRPEIGLGSFANGQLADAREIAADVRKLARKGIPPSHAWKKHLTDGEEGHTNAPVFDQWVQQAMGKVSAELSNPKHIPQWTSTLKQ